MIFNLMEYETMDAPKMALAAAPFQPPAGPEY